MSIMGPLIEIDIHPNILKEYDFEVKNLVKMGSAIKVESNLGTYTFKKTDISLTQAKRMQEILEFLKQNNFPVPVLMPNKFGDIFIPVKDSIIYVTKWIEGKPLTLNYNPHLLKSISMMAHMHNIGFSFISQTSDYRYIDEIHLKNSWEERINWLQRYHNKLKRKSSKTTFEHIFLTYIPFLKDWSEEAVEHFNQWVIQYNSMEKMRKTISHGRFHHRNIVITPKEKVFLIDFDHVSIDTPVRDLAYFIRNYILNKEQQMWALEWVRNYQKIVKLTSAEKKLLGIYLLFPERMFTLAKRYEEKQYNWSEDVYLKKLQVRWAQMKEMNWFIDQYHWLND